MILRPSYLCNRRGAAAVEFAIVMPLFVTLMLGIWEVARMVHVQQVVSSAAREGGRQAAAGQLSNDDVKKVVYRHLNNDGIQVTDSSENPLSSVVVTVQNKTAAGVDATAANKLDRFSITVEIPYSLVRWTTLDHFGGPTTKINATVDWYSVRNTPLTLSETIPSQP